MTAAPAASPTTDESPRPARSLAYLPLGELTPDPRNPKDHDHGLIDASVGRFGYIEPMVIDERTGRLVAGHGRRTTLLAMYDRGELPPDGVHADADGRWLVPVVRGWSSRADTEAAAALIGLNRSTEVGGWVDAELLELLSELTSDPLAGLVGVGFSDDELDALRQRLDDEALVDGWDPDSDAGDPGDLSVAVRGDVREVVVVFPSDRYAELYGILSALPWVSDVRDKKVM
jgi:ParB-like chromosome segregation protein Spo0J